MLLPLLLEEYSFFRFCFAVMFDDLVVLPVSGVGSLNELNSHPRFIDMATAAALFPFGTLSTCSELGRMGMGRAAFGQD